MADIISRDDAVDRLAAHAEAIGHLAQDSGAFAAAVAAFESRDGDAFRWVLNRAEMLPYCELICEWVRIKLGVLRCIEICGAPRDDTPPDLQQFARAVVQLASDETRLRRIVDAVSCGDGDDYRAAIAELKLEPFCHLICHWVYFIIYRRVCEVVCLPERIRLADAVSEVRAASRDVAILLEDESAFAAIGKAAIHLDCVTIRSRINEAGFQPHCELFCWLICTWRCAWVCWEFCRIRPPILVGVDAIDEARAFALAIRPFAGKPRALSDLVNAVINRDAKAYGEIISRWGLEHYCVQVCAWVCQLVCREFCICICPPPVLRPWFTTVGDFDIYTQIDPASGKTSTSLAQTLAMPWGAGPNFAFFDELQLGGWCPSFSPIAPGTPMRYRFLFATNKTTLAANITAVQGTITVAGGPAQPTPFKISVCVDGQIGETMTVTAVAANTWTVTRGQDGTTAAAATAGAEVWIDPKPITGALSGTELPVGQKIVPWPANVGGFAGAPTPTFVPIVVAPGAATDPIAPSSGAPWVTQALSSPGRRRLGRHRHGQHQRRLSETDQFRHQATHGRGLPPAAAGQPLAVLQRRERCRWCTGRQRGHGRRARQRHGFGHHLPGHSDIDGFHRLLQLALQDTYQQLGRGQQPLDSAIQWPAELLHAHRFESHGAIHRGPRRDGRRRVVAEHHQLQRVRAGRHHSDRAQRSAASSHAQFSRRFW